MMERIFFYGCDKNFEGVLESILKNKNKNKSGTTAQNKQKVLAEPTIR
jgi:hypothetical protein